MIYQNIDFHGVTELVERAGGVQLQRMPAEIRNNLNNRGKWNSPLATNIDSIETYKVAPNCELCGR